MNIRKTITIGATLSLLFMAAPAIANAEPNNIDKPQLSAAAIQIDDSIVARATAQYELAKEQLQQAKDAVSAPCAIVKAAGESDSDFATRVHDAKRVEFQQLRHYQAELRKQERNLATARAIQSGDYWDPSIN